MKDILEFIIKSITTNPQDVQITEQDEDGVTNYLVTVNPDDVGRIIGKEGKIIKSIRAIMRVIAIQRGLHIRVSVVSETDGNTAPESEESAPTEATPASTEDSLTVEL